MGEIREEASDMPLAGAAEPRYPPEAWRRVATEIKRRRVHLQMTQPQVHAAGGPSVSMISNIEGAKKDHYDARALARLEIALRFETGSIASLLEGGEATPLTEQVSPGAAAEGWVLVAVPPGLNERHRRVVVRVAESLARELNDA
jgi:hypothetical protein